MSYGASGLCRRSYFGPRTCGGSIDEQICQSERCVFILLQDLCAYDNFEAVCGGETVSAMSVCGTKSSVEVEWGLFTRSSEIKTGVPGAKRCGKNGKSFNWYFLDPRRLFLVTKAVWTHSTPDTVVHCVRSERKT